MIRRRPYVRQLCDRLGENFVTEDIEKVLWELHRACCAAVSLENLVRGCALSPERTIEALHRLIAVNAVQVEKRAGRDLEYVLNLRIGTVTIPAA